MRAAIDAAGRLVIPKPLREQLGLQPGPVEVTADGAALRVEPVIDDSVETDGDLLVIPAAGSVLTDAMVRDMLDAGRR
jgi:AbrB family looped-hinge helix DNA binding protein